MTELVRTGIKTAVVDRARSLGRAVGWAEVSGPSRAMKRAHELWPVFGQQVLRQTTSVGSEPRAKPWLARSPAPRTGSSTTGAFARQVNGPRRAPSPRAGALAMRAPEVFARRAWERLTRPLSASFHPRSSEHRALEAKPNVITLRCCGGQLPSLSTGSIRFLVCRNQTVVPQAEVLPPVRLLLRIGGRHHEPGSPRTNSTPDQQHRHPEDDPRNLLHWYLRRGGYRNA
jgi:hypothetical protein